MKIKKVDPGTFSFLQPGWWAFHTVAIGSMVLLGKVIEKRN